MQWIALPIIYNQTIRASRTNYFHIYFTPTLIGLFTGALINSPLGLCQEEAHRRFWKKFMFTCSNVYTYARFLITEPNGLKYTNVSFLFLFLFLLFSARCRNLHLTITMFHNMAETDWQRALMVEADDSPISIDGPSLLLPWNHASGRSGNTAAMQKIRHPHQLQWRHQTHVCLSITHLCNLSMLLASSVSQWLGFHGHPKHDRVVSHSLFWLDGHLFVPSFCTKK